MTWKRFKIIIILLAGALIYACEGPPEEPVSMPVIPELDSLITEALRSSKFAGAVLLAGNKDEILHHKAYGYATLYDENLRVVSLPDSMTTAHIFDLASLTKIFATTYGLMALHTDGVIDIDDPAANYLAEFESDTHRKITIGHLLNHSSGLMQWYPTYYVAESKEERRRFIAEQPLIGKPGEARRYSDPGFMILGDIIEAASGMSMEIYLKERIYAQMGLHRTEFIPDLSADYPVVSTSHGNPFEKKMVYVPGFGYHVDVDPDSWGDWRNYTLRGEVNDGNAFYTHGGVAGHAGLFSVAEELYELLLLVLNNGNYKGEQLIASETIQLFTASDSLGNGLGWAKTPSLLHANELPAGSIGHTGFTGTNFVMSPGDGRFYILLSNRQHSGVDENGNYPDLRSLREAISAGVFK